MKRVLTSYYRPKPGGLCKRYFRGLEALLAEGSEVRYLAVERFPIEHSRCHFHRFPWPAARADGALFWIAFHLLAPWLLLWLGLWHRATHLLAFEISYAFVLQPLRLLSGRPLALFLRADSLENQRIKQRPRLVLRLLALVEAVAISGSCLYGVSASLTGRVVARHAWARPRSSGVLPNELGEFREAPARPPDAPLRLGCVGILEARKNQWLLLDCMAALRGLPLRLELYGVGPQEAALRRHAAFLQLDDCVRFHGWMTAAQIWPALDLLLAPSLHEGAPNAVLEAVAAGVPVLASDTEEHREILPAAGLLPLSRSAAWTERIRDCLEHPDALTALLAAERRAMAGLRFDWERRFLGCVLGCGVAA